MEKHPKALLEANSFRYEVSLGCSAEERAKLQPVEVDLRFAFFSDCSFEKTDLLKDTICYDKVSTLISKTLEGREFNLVEHLSRVIFEAIKASLSSDEIKLQIRLTKLEPPIQVANRGVTYVMGDWIWP